MDLLSSISQSLSQALSPGHRVPRAKGWELAEKYPMPRNCEVIILDEDPNADYIYMKATDENGAEKFARYKIVEEPIPKFDPDKYVTTNEFNKLKEEISSGFDSIRQLISANAERSANSARPNGSVKQSSRSSSELSRPESDIHTNG